MVNDLKKENKKRRKKRIKIERWKMKIIIKKQIVGTFKLGKMSRNNTFWTFTLLTFSANSDH